MNLTLPGQAQGLPLPVKILELVQPEALVLLLGLGLLLALAWRRERGKGPTYLRPIPGFEAARKAISASAETGKAVHLSAGTGSLGAFTTLPTLAGLELLAPLIQHAATLGSAFLTTTPSPLVMLVLESKVRRAFRAAGHPEEFAPAQVRFIGDAPTAYAAGVMGALTRENVASNIMAGAFGDEYLLMGETAARKGIEGIVGNADPSVLPFALASADHLIMGEELYAAGAYLGRKPWHRASLQAQDWLRLGLVGAILLAVLLKTTLGVP
ncbi:MAG: hypothetical protein HY871_03540 [Chloroflexi bacterium]|nr:hypothetical protein [Chloroflexota bacterium]